MIGNEQSLLENGVYTLEVEMNWDWFAFCEFKFHVLVDLKWEFLYCMCFG